jgi:hypothetical protein
MGTSINFSKGPLNAGQKQQLTQAVNGKPAKGFKIEQNIDGMTSQSRWTMVSDPRLFKAYKAVGQGILNNVPASQLPQKYKDLAGLDNNPQWSDTEKATLGFLLDKESAAVGNKITITEDELKGFPTKKGYEWDAAEFYNSRFQVAEQALKRQKNK